TFTPKFFSMFSTHAICEYTLSTELPINCTLRFSNSGLRLENSTNSVVHTGVKSAGWENSNTHLPFEVELLRRIMPCVDFASKWGPGSLMRGNLVISVISDIFAAPATKFDGTSGNDIRT